MLATFIGDRRIAVGASADISQVHDIRAVYVRGTQVRGESTTRPNLDQVEGHAE